LFPFLAVREEASVLPPDFFEDFALSVSVQGKQDQRVHYTEPPEFARLRICLAEPLS